MWSNHLCLSEVTEEYSLSAQENIGRKNIIWMDREVVMSSGRFYADIYIWYISEMYDCQKWLKNIPCQHRKTSAGKWMDRGVVMSSGRFYADIYIWYISEMYFQRGDKTQQNLILKSGSGQYQQQKLVIHWTFWVIMKGQRVDIFLIIIYILISVCHVMKSVTEVTYHDTLTKLSWN